MTQQHNEPPAFSGKIVWAALRQLQALRESLSWTLNGKFLFQATEEEASGLCASNKFTDGWTLLTLDDDTLPLWLRQQGLGEFAREGHTSIDMAIEGYRLHLLSADAYKALRTGQLSAQDTDDFGAKRSGVGWLHSINFCITSAFVRLLGALEQYEIDVLKALFYHRHTGKPLGPEQEHIVESADESVVREEPTPDPDESSRLVYKKPAIWTWVRKHAENNEERRKILASVFGINATPGTTNNERKKNNRYRQDLYSKRNAIAHGRKTVEITLAEYVKADVFIYRSIAHVAEQCLAHQKLIV